MSDQSDEAHAPPHPRVVMAETDAERDAETLAPQVITTAISGRILSPAPVAPPQVPAGPPPRSAPASAAPG
jgi:hypothetical protein